MESEYHVGDRVKILDPVPEAWVGTTAFMRQQAGKTTTIIDIYPSEHTIDGYIYRLDRMRGWNWESNQFEREIEFELNAEEDTDECGASFGEFLDGFKSA